ncbi:hypothetical protein MKW92_009407 [Papaver armeniacum]|nr:hypothetical protein MKW92_009407 [Papaver armeniacum]
MHYLNSSGHSPKLSNHIDFLYSDRRSVKRRRREKEEIINYRRRREEEEDINYGRSSNRRRIEESRREDINYKRRRRREESSGRRDDINYSRSSNNYGQSSYRRKRAGDNDITFTFHSCGLSCLDRSLIKEGKCDAVSIKFYEEDDATPIGSFPCFVDDVIVREILSRLPAKTLLRFKSVCKYWLSLIAQDQDFIHLHTIRSKSRLNLLCMAPLPEQNEMLLPMRILSANLSVKTTGGEGKVIIHNVKKETNDNWFYYDKVLEPVNGLVCFIHWETTAVRIYNVSTREVTPWIKSTLLAEEKDKFESEDNPLKISSNFRQIYQMGFDLEKNEHKVFCFWRLSSVPESFIGSYSDSASSYASWEALTVGRDTKWRRISVTPNENNLIKLNEVVPPYGPGVQANGSIYWRNKLMSREEDLIDPENVFRDYVPTDPDVIIAFDVGSEKFRVIPIPSFILDEPREKMFSGPIAMLILGGRVTLMYQMSSRIAKLWMLEDDGVDKKLENCQGKGSSNWSAETITLPFCYDTRFCNVHGVATNADKILISIYGDISGIHKKLAGLYSYDRKTMTLEKIDMDGVSSIPPLHCNTSLLTTYTESLIPVQPPQQNKSRQSELVF